MTCSATCNLSSTTFAQHDLRTGIMLNGKQSTHTGLTLQINASANESCLRKALSEIMEKVCEKGSCKLLARISFDDLHFQELLVALQHSEDLGSRFYSAVPLYTMSSCKRGLRIQAMGLIIDKNLNWHSCFTFPTGEYAVDGRLRGAHRASPDWMRDNTLAELKSSKLQFDRQTPVKLPLLEYKAELFWWVVGCNLQPLGHSFLQEHFDREPTAVIPGRSNQKQGLSAADLWPHRGGRSTTSPGSHRKKAVFTRLRPTGNRGMEGTEGARPWSLAKLSDLWGSHQLPPMRPSWSLLVRSPLSCGTWSLFDCWARGPLEVDTKIFANWRPCI